jgi:hypothetical protein
MNTDLLRSDGREQRVHIARRRATRSSTSTSNSRRASCRDERKLSRVLLLGRLKLTESVLGSDNGAREVLLELIESALMVGLDLNEGRSEALLGGSHPLLSLSPDLLQRSNVLLAAFAECHTQPLGLLALFLGQASDGSGVIDTETFERGRVAGLLAVKGFGVLDLDASEIGDELGLAVGEPIDVLLVKSGDSGSVLLLRLRERAVALELGALEVVGMRGAEPREFGGASRGPRRQSGLVLRAQLVGRALVLSDEPSA